MIIEEIMSEVNRLMDLTEVQSHTLNSILRTKFGEMSDNEGGIEGLTRTLVQAYIQEPEVQNIMTEFQPQGLLSVSRAISKQGGPVLNLIFSGIPASHDSDQVYYVGN